MPFIIKLEKIHFRWEKKSKDILIFPDLKVESGQHVFIQGPSGSGKTTLLNLITGIYSPYRGKIIVLNQEINSLAIYKRDLFRANHLGVIFQQFNLLPYLSILENVTLAARFSPNKTRQINNQGKTVVEEACRLLKALQIPSSLLKQSVHRLSVGQQQRVAAARALIGKPEIIIADEPTSALDHENKSYFLELLFSEANKQKSTLIFVSHDTQLQSRFDQTINLEYHTTNFSK